MIAHARAPVAIGGAAFLRAPLSGVPNEAWSQFVHALAIADEICDPQSPDYQRPRAPDARTPSGGLGCFDLRPPRLADLGLMRGVRVDNTTGCCVWVGEFILPMTQARFFQNPLVQYNALCESLRRYDRQVAAALPEDMTRSGMLALHHRLGPRAFVKWAEHQEPATMALFHRANGLF